MKIIGKTASDIYASIRAQVQSRELAPGQALPPVRELAAALGVNRNTVAAAYKRLVGAGIAVTQGRNGTAIRASAGPGEQEGALPGSPLIDVGSGNPAPDWLPDLRQGLTAVAPTPRLYGEPTVAPAFEARARAWLGDEPPAAYALDLSHGAVDAIERLLAAWLVPGDQVAVEDPCFLGSLNTLRNAGLRAVPVPVDGEGLQPQALAQALEQGVQALICTPRAHNPTGCSLSAARAEALRRVLARHPQVLLIEDDHFAPLAREPYRPLIAAGARRWALLRSLSKCFGPDLRLALVASDPETSRRLRLRLAPGSTWVSHLLQDLAGGFMASEAVAGRIAAARDDYARRRSWLVAALAAEGFEARMPCDGLNVWVPLPIEGRDAAQRLALRGWLVRAGEAFCIEAPGWAIRVTVATLEEAQARRFAVDLRRCVDGM